ncbi:MAG: glycosyltransferase family 39 protein [Syntrophaceae bacterium]|nr:glycosyltransferase family 39 protein [Syntrophaceae bacterium]
MDNQLYKLRKLIGPSILVVIGSYMLHLSWFKWPDLLIDYGRELYVPWQITQGKILYADIHHLYGPLAHYFNALLFQIFGAGLSTLAYFNIVVTILITAMIYTLIKSSFGDLIATTAGICFLVIFACSQYVGISNYNFVCPYSHEVTYGILLFFLALTLLRKYLVNQKIIYASLIGLITGLIFLTKVEIFIAGFISILAGLIFIFRQSKPLHFKKHLFHFIFFALLPVIAFFIYFSLHMPVTEAFNVIIASYKNIFIGELTHNIYYLRMSGFNNPAQNVTLMLVKTFNYLLFFVFVGVIAYSFTRFSKKHFGYGAVVILWALIILFVFFLLFPINWLDIARPFPVLTLLLLAYLIIDLIRKRKDKIFIAQHLPFIVFVLFSLLLLMKIILRVRFYHYGFALAMPATLAMLVLFLYYIPLFFSRWGNKNVVISFSGLFILLTLLFYLDFTKNVYDMKNYPVAQGRDRFLTYDDNFFNYGPVLTKTLEFIDKSMSLQDTFIVIPDGIMLNYLSRRNNPSRYFEFTPNFVEATGEENIINDISRNRPSFIILTKKNTSEHGAQYFGADYARNIYSWITDNYDKVISIGDDTLTGNDFGIAIMKLKNDV